MPVLRFDDESLCEDSLQISPLLCEENAAGRKIIALQRELQRQAAGSAKFQKRVKELENELALARQKLLYNKTPSSAVSDWVLLLEH